MYEDLSKPLGYILGSPKTSQGFTGEESMGFSGSAGLRQGVECGLPIPTERASSLPPFLVQWWGSSAQVEEKQKKPTLLQFPPGTLSSLQSSVT